MIVPMKNKFMIALIASFAVGACTYDFPEAVEPTLGNVSFDKMVSVGNSLTAGFMDNALYSASQSNSFPSIIARQAALLGGGVFLQPTVTSANGCSNPAGGCTQGRLYLKLNLSTGAASPTPTPGDATALGPYTGSKTALNNWGVPGVTIQTAQHPALGGPPTSNPFYNPYYARIASNPGSSTLIGDAKAAMASGGTFFTFWLGNNDVLGYATGGASNPAILTSQAAFQAAFNAALNEMLSANANGKGAVANVPNVTTIPFFTTVPPNPVTLDAATVNVLNSNFAGYNATLDAFKGAPFNLNADEMNGRKITFTAGAGNRLVINDETARDLGPYWDQLVTAGMMSSSQRAQLEPFRFARQARVAATGGDLVVLPAASFIGTTVGGNPQLVNGVSVPLADQWILLPSEQTEIQNSINGFNTIISNAVNANADRLVLIDANKALVDIRAGIVTINGSSITASISPPFGAFSLDGVHPNARGSAYIANLFIEAINKKWGSKIPLCNPNDFVGNALPRP
jgi:hypothetical protein